jgi:serralysin
VQTAAGYDIAWKMSGANEYTIWSTDSSGNYLSNLTPPVAGNSTTLENYETIFHQDLNGDGIIGVPSATASAAAQAAQASQTAFDGQTLTLDAPSTFTGQLIGFGGDGTLAGSDQVDLRGFNFDTLHTSFNSASDTLSLSSGASTASLQFLGQYSQDSFHFADDGNGGTLIVAAMPVAQATATNEVSSFAAHDTFVFAPNFGNITLPSFAPATDTLQFSKTVFANVTALLAATHDDGFGNAVITDAAHDTITLQHVTTAQLIAHQSDFHFV